MPEFKKDTAFLPSTFSGKVKNQRKLKTTEKLRTPENSLKGRNDGRLMPGARRRTLCTAAAVDHADTELIGHDGQMKTPGFFVVAAGLQIMAQIKIMTRPIEED